MSQNDFNIANQGFPSFRSDLNNALQALASNNAGAAEPSTTYANQWWYDTTTGLLKLRNEANTNWIAPNFGEISNVNITGGTIDGAVIGGVAPADVTASSLVVNGNNYPSAGALSNRNLIINGAMQVAQRGTSSTGVTTGDYYTCDRFQSAISNLGAYTVTQEADGPSGFANSIKMEVTTADASPAAADWLFLNYTIEGQDLQQLAKGTADAKPIVLSFWVKSNKTGTYQVSLQDSDNARMVSGTYTVDVSATWEYKTIAVPADTTGAFNNDANASLNIEWWFDSGSDFTGGAVPTAWETLSNPDRNTGSNVNLADTIGNYIQITGVQLEVGDTATPFEHRSYGQELSLCQRYYESGTMYRSGAIATGTSGISTYNYLVEKRVSSTMTSVGTAFINFTGVVVNAGIKYFNHYPTGGTSGGQGRYAINWTADAEL